MPHSDPPADPLAPLAAALQDCEHAVELPAPPPLADPIPGPAVRPSVWLSRVGWLFLFIIPLAVVVTAARLTPDASGVGTHQQLGLPPCGFLVITGIPCPGCGLTTSFSHMVRAQFTGATRANPFGVMLFFVTFFTIPIAAMGFYRGSPVLDTLERLHAEKWAILLSVTSLLVWGIRVARHLMH